MRELDAMGWGGPDKEPVDIDKLLADAIAADLAARAAFGACTAVHHSPEQLDALFAMKLAARDLCHIKNLHKDVTQRRREARHRRRQAEQDRREGRVKFSLPIKSSPKMVIVDGERVPVIVKTEPTS
jgi:Rad3-related DNA helicase